MEEKEGGYDTSWFVDEKSIEKYICSICTMVARSSRVTECDHIFCSECLKKWLQIKNECPNCKKQEPVVDKSTFTDKLILDLTVHPSRKRKFDDSGKSVTLRDRIKTGESKRWCILCCKDVDSEHKDCSTRMKDVQIGIVKRNMGGRNIKFGEITYETFVSNSRRIATKQITLNDLQNISTFPIKVKDAWVTMSIQHAKPNTSDAELDIRFYACQNFDKSYSGFGIQQLLCLFVTYIDTTTKEFMLFVPSVFSADQASTLSTGDSINMQDFAKDIYSMNCVSFSFVSYYNFTLKPP